MPLVLRSRLALLGLLGVLLLPVVTSSMRGLTHVLTCRESAGVPFTVSVPERGAPVVASGITTTAGEASPQVCGGLSLDLAVGRVDDRHLRVILPITNTTPYGWRGTVELTVGSQTLPVAIGAIPARGTRVESVSIEVEPGAREIAGSLLVGP